MRSERAPSCARRSRLPCMLRRARNELRPRWCLCWVSLVQATAWCGPRSRQPSRAFRARFLEQVTLQHYHYTLHHPHYWITAADFPALWSSKRRLHTPTGGYLGPESLFQRKAQYPAQLEGHCNSAERSPEPQRDDGSVGWKTYFVEMPSRTNDADAEVAHLGPSGAAVWSERYV